MSRISDRLDQTRQQIASVCDRTGRDVERVKLVVVTKTATIDQIKEVVRAGCRNLGENRVQHLKQISTAIQEFIEASRNDPEVPREVNWHMIGHLQRNKVKHVLKISSLIHSVDTLRLAEEINFAADKLDINSEILLQVNCSGESQKYGVPVGAATHLAEQFLTMKNLRLVGLMTMAPLTRDKDVVRACFIRARELFTEIAVKLPVGREFKHLSMGMSQDFEIAIEEGATILRIGSAIFAG